jgi:hypothetical protein
MEKNNIQINERKLLINEKKDYGQMPGFDVLVELVEPVAAVPEPEEQLDSEPPALLDEVDCTPL